MGIAGILIGRAAVLQLLPQPRLAALAHRQYRSHALVRPRRGALLDRNGEALAVNVETHSLAANPQRIAANARGALARLLAQATHQNVSRLEKRLAQNREFIWIKRQLEPNELRALRRVRLLDESQTLAPGLHLVEESRRVYPQHRLAAHVLGSVDIDSEGLEGMEFALNSRLRGESSNRQGVRDMRGRPTFVDLNPKNPGREGESITLSLDASLQFALEEALHQDIKKTQASAGTIIVMHAQTGEILSLANEPTFDPEVRQSNAAARRNRALTDQYEPGSTLKTLLLASYLKGGGKLSDRIYAEHGRLKIGQHLITEAEAHEKFDWITLRQMLQYSSNVAAAKCALKLGAPNFLATLSEFGLGQSTGIHFPGESTPTLANARAIDPLTLATMGFGQGLSVTPLQMVRAYAPFINQGLLVRPTLLKAAETADAPRVLTRSQAREICEALRLVILEGTGQSAAIPGFEIVGKTGTSQWVEEGAAGYSADKYVASFIGALVDEHHPLVILTLLHGPKGPYYAAETAVPLFRKVALAIIQRYALEPKSGIASPLVPLPLVPSGVQASSPPLPAVPPPVPASEQTDVQAMPDLRGLDVRAAYQKLTRLSPAGSPPLRLNITGEGLVVRQSPMPNHRIQERALITLHLDNN